MTRAAEALHVTQPTLSKQMKALEAELKKDLFIRHAFSIELTDEGQLLRKRAEDLVDMADKILDEFSATDDITGGDFYFGLAESYQIRLLAREIRNFKTRYPNLHYHITVDDLLDVPLFCSEQSWKADIPRWAGAKMKDLHLEGSFQLSYNGAIFAAEKLGILLTLDKLINTGDLSELVSRPLLPVLENKMYLVWKKYQMFSPIAEKFLTEISKTLQAEA